MTSLPSQHPSLSLHLTDSTLTPLITSSSSPSHLDSLTSLASTALASHPAVARVSLGRPQRIMVEYPDRGAVILQSYIEPQQPTPSQSQPSHQEAGEQTGLASRPGSKTTSISSSAGGGSYAQKTTTTTAAGGASDDGPPRLVSVVVAGSADQTKEARRAAARLERVGREFQREWATDSSLRLEE